MFGNPVRNRKGLRGRPAFEVTDRNLNKVKLLLAAGWSIDRIANAIQCSVATLRRHFRFVLTEREKMRDRLEAERMMLAMEQAAKGNVGAMRQFGQLLDRNDRMEADRALAAKPKAEPVGKKVQARVDARHAIDALELELMQAAERDPDVRH